MDKLDIIKALLSDTPNNASVQESPALPFEVGKSYFIRTVTYHTVGRVIAVVGKFLILSDAAWVADSGRFSPAINDGTLSEVEPVRVTVTLNTDSIVDAFDWTHPLPREQK